jgi:hypothetical protein
MARKPRHIRNLRNGLRAGRLQHSSIGRSMERGPLGPLTTRSNCLVVTFSKTPSRFLLDHVIKWPIEICIERVRPVGLARQIAPVFVHPEPGSWVLSHIRFKRIPACLCNVLIVHPVCVRNLRVEDKPVTAIRQRLAVRGNDRNTGAFVQPGMRGSHACL